MSRAASDHDDNDRLGIQSVEIAADILRALASSGGSMQLRELSAATEMHRGKVHRYLTSLTKSGLLAQDADTSAYRVGQLAITLGLTGLRSLDPVRIALRDMPRFADEVNETVVVSIWGDMGPTVIAIQESSRFITLNMRAGSILPLRTSAAGQIFEAYLPTSVIATLLDRREAGNIHGKTLKHRTPLSEVRAHGLARVEGDLIPGINAIAAPVFNHFGKLCLVVGILGQKDLLDVSNKSPIAKTLKTFAKTISQELGYRPTANST